MKANSSKKWRRKIVRFSIWLFILYVLILIISSPFAKYFIEKYDTYYTGREITVESAYMNPFTGYISFDNLIIYELESDTVFFSADKISADFAMLKMLGGVYEITSIKLTKPYGNIIQDANRHLNFRDWILRWRPKIKKVKKEPVHFSILKIEVTDGRFFYIEKNIPVNYSIKHVNLLSTGFRWNTDTVSTAFSFNAGLGAGAAKGNFTVNTSNADYRMSVKVQNYELAFIEQYLQEFINFGDFRANFDADINARGSFKEAQNLIAAGMLSLNDFHVGKSQHDDYASFTRLKFKINRLSPKHRYYDFDSVLLENAYAKYEQYDYLSNVERMFGQKGQNIYAVNETRGGHNLIIQLARYIEQLARNFLKSNYRVNRFAITNANLQFNDYAINEKFSVRTFPLTLTCDSADKSHKRVRIRVSSGIKPYGSMKLNASINPNDSSDFEFMFNLHNIPATIFNPYMVTYTSYPLDRGIVEFTGIWRVLDGNIKGNNNLRVIDARLSKRERNKENKKFPAWLVMFLARDNHNIINYEIPVSGNLKAPSFHWKDVIDDIVWNFFVKPPTTPKREQLRHIETKIEISKEISWRLNSFELNRLQKKLLEKASRFLNEDPSATLVIQPVMYEEKEKEHLLIFEAKKQYYMHVNKLKIISKLDSVRIDRMSIKDSLLFQYLSSLCKNPLLFTVQSKAECIWGGKIKQLIKQLHSKRLAAFYSCFNPAVRSQVKVMKTNNSIPFNGLSVFKLHFKGNIPLYLENAYKKMEELDNKPPRNAYRKFRKHNRRNK